MEVCAGFELIVIENATALGDDVLEISKRREAQMIGHMRHGSPPRLLALQSILSPNRRESLPTLQPESVLYYLRLISSGWLAWATNGSLCRV